MPELRLDAGGGVVLRPWRAADRDTLAAFANNRAIWRNLRDRFPNPYTVKDAEQWIAFCASAPPPCTRFAIDLGGRAIGGIGFETQPDDEVHRLNAEIGYWLAEPYWGRGIATAAATAATHYGFREFPWARIQATVFAWNPASARVLEKAGYAFEGRLRSYIIKDGQLIDALLYARLRP